MIRRVYILMLLLIVLPDIFIWLHYYKRGNELRAVGKKICPRPIWHAIESLHISSTSLKILWWVPCVVMIAYTIGLASIHNFAPTDLTWLNTYLFLFGIIIMPKALFVLFSWIGSAIRKIFHTRYNYGHRLGLIAGILGVITYIYGLTFGLTRIKVNHVTLKFDSLPEEFDGFRILHISDLHVGTFDGWRRRILQAEIDSIKAQKNIDLVCFTGDMQNMRPQEVAKMMPILKQLPYTYFVLGNHDYAQYVRQFPGVEQKMKRQLINEENKLGKVLLNNNIRITRRDTVGNNITVSSIWLAGEENDGRPPFPSRGNLQKTLNGLTRSDFVILLQHDPSAWRRDILPHSNVQLTLSGHTHGGQMQILGWRPTMLTTKEDRGLYEDKGRYLYVNAGLGGLVPFRLNMANEITVIELRVKN